MKTIYAAGCLLVGLSFAGCSSQIPPAEQLGITNDATWYIDQLGSENVRIYDVTEHVFGENYEEYLDPEGYMFMTIVVHCEQDEHGIVRFGVSRSGHQLPYSANELYSKGFRESSSKWVPGCKPLQAP